MTEQQAKETLNKPHICREAEKSIRDMKIKLSKFKGDKTEQTKHLQNLDNLLNLSHKQALEIDDYSDLTAQYIMKIGEMNSRLKDMAEKYYISEKIHEMGVDEVVKEYQSKL
mgnify:CR=1 FL=1|tara:strand:+ start:654 stop:989 length:336 start_codon:yes stop_codon:yes gene_type:complete